MSDNLNIDEDNKYTEEKRFIGCMKFFKNLFKTEDSEAEEAKITVFKNQFAL